MLKCHICGKKHNASVHAEVSRKLGQMAASYLAPVTKNATKPAKVTPKVTKMPAVTNWRDRNTPAVGGHLVPGEPCPTCGRKVPMTAAQRKRRERERRRE